LLSILFIYLPISMHSAAAPEAFKGKRAILVYNVHFGYAKLLWFAYIRTKILAQFEYK